MDVLDDILTTLNLKGALYFRTDFSPPWAVTVPDLVGAARFHLVVQGHCHLKVSTGAYVKLGPGDLAMVPAGAGHTLSHKQVHEAPPLESVLEDANYDGSGVLAIGQGDARASTQMICGHYTFREGADHPLLRALPELLLTSTSDRAREPLLDETLRLLTRRIFSPAPGSTAAVTRLSESVFIELIRMGVQQSAEMRSVVSALQDKQIGRTLALIHAQPESPWTVGGLAQEAGMSRSRFAEKFRDLVGMGPMAYLSDWRLQKALSLLDDSRCSVQQVASQTGYQSPAAFTRAFSSKFGTPPTEYRRQLA